MVDSNINEIPSVPAWKKISGYLLLIAVLFFVGAVTGLLKSEIGPSGALRNGYVYARAALVMIVFAYSVLRLCEQLALGALASSMIGFGAAVGSMQATCEALNGHYDSIAPSGIEGIVIGALCGAIAYWRQKTLVPPPGTVSQSNSAE